MSAVSAVAEGLRAVRRRPALLALLLAVNLSTAALLAVPLVGVLEDSLKNTDASGNMLYGFDHAWWTAWHTGRTGWTASFRPDIFGAGFAVKNLDLLLRGALPARSFESAEDALNDYPVDGVILGLGAAYLVVQAFLTGGALGALRGPQGSAPPRGLLYGSAFYFGRILRVAALALCLDGVLFWLNAPFAIWVENRAREAVSETTALAWLFGRHLLLLAALLLVQLLSSYAKVIVVLEERRSALLALVSAAGFCLRNLRRAFGHALLIALLGVTLVAAWSALDGAFETTGYKTQLVALALSQGLVLGLIGLRLSLYAGQIALYRALPKGL
jgi:hypothetical protein